MTADTTKIFTSAQIRRAAGDAAGEAQRVLAKEVTPENTTDRLPAIKDIPVQLGQLAEHMISQNIVSGKAIARFLGEEIEKESQKPEESLETLAGLTFFANKLGLKEQIKHAARGEASGNRHTSITHG